MAETTASVRELLSVHLEDDRRWLIVRERAGGKPIVRRARAEFVTWHRREQLPKPMRREVEALPHVRSLSVDGEWVRIGWNDDYTRAMGRNFMAANGIDVYEGDVDPVMLHMVEQKLPIAKQRRCYLDIETDSRVPLSRKEEMRVLSWVVVDHETGEEVSGMLEEETDAAEAALLRELAATLRGYDQIAVWEGNWTGGEFDSYVVPARCAMRGVRFDPRDWLWLNQLAVWSRHSSSESGAEGSLKLDVIAHEQIGEGKEHAPEWVVERLGVDRCRGGLGAMSWDLWEAGGRFRDLLLTYNARDAQILRRLEIKKGYCGLHAMLSTLCGLTPENKSLEPIRLMDGFMLRLGRKMGRRFPTRKRRGEGEEEPKKFKGAVVFPPKSVANKKPKPGEDEWTAADAKAWREKHGFKNGILHGVHVCDFSGMYPSIMLTFNLGSEVKAGWVKKPEQLKDGQCMSPGTGLVTRLDERGMVTFALAELIRMRKQYADLAASLPPGTEEWIDAMGMSTACKVAANSFYGAGGSPNSRFYDRDVSEATTQNAVHFLKLAARESEVRNSVLVYGDTDATFIYGPSIAGFDRFVGWLNGTKFPEEVKRHRCAENHVKIAFEKSYDRIVFVSKKRYVARYSHYKHSTTCNECRKASGQPGSVDVHTMTCRDCGHVYDAMPRFLGKPEIKGVAYKRGETTSIAREFQAKIIDMLVGGLTVKGDDGKEQPANPGVDTPTEDVLTYQRLIERYRDKCLVGELALEDVVHRKGMSKSLREFDKEAKDAHVRVARVLVERGIQVSRGMKVEYVVVDSTEAPQRVIPAVDFVGDCDRHHLWEQTWDPSKELLEAAFPDEDWSQWDAARPKKARASAKRQVPEEQLGLAIAEPVKGKQQRVVGDEVAVPAYRASDLRIKVPESAGPNAVERVKRALEAHPGARSVVIVIGLASGQEALVRTQIRVSPGPKLREAIDAAIAAP